MNLELVCRLSPAPPCGLLGALTAMPAGLGLPVPLRFAFLSGLSVVLPTDPAQLLHRFVVTLLLRAPVDLLGGQVLVHLEDDPGPPPLDRVDSTWPRRLPPRGPPLAESEEPREVPHECESLVEDEEHAKRALRWSRPET